MWKREKHSSRGHLTKRYTGREACRQVAQKLFCVLSVAEWHLPRLNSADTAMCPYLGQKIGTVQEHKATNIYYLTQFLWVRSSWARRFALSLLVPAIEMLACIAIRPKLGCGWRIWKVVGKRPQFLILWTVPESSSHIFKLEQLLYSKLRLESKVEDPVSHNLALEITPSSFYHIIMSSNTTPI